MKLHEGGYVELLSMQVNQGKTFYHLGLEPKCAAYVMLPEQRANTWKWELWLLAPAFVLPEQGQEFWNPNIKFYED